MNKVKATVLFVIPSIELMPLFTGKLEQSVKRFIFNKFLSRALHRNSRKEISCFCDLRISDIPYISAQIPINIVGNKKECCHGILEATDCSFTKEDYTLDVNTSYKNKQATDTPLHFIATGANEG